MGAPFSRPLREVGPRKMCQARRLVLKGKTLVGKDIINSPSPKKPGRKWDTLSLFANEKWATRRGRNESGHINWQRLGQLARIVRSTRVRFAPGTKIYSVEAYAKNVCRNEAELR